MIDLNQDLNIFYSGGSGGFIFLHWILLLDRHYCVLPADLNISKQNRLKFQNQYSINESHYCAIKDQSWPEYQDYLQKKQSLNPQIKQETIRQYSLHADDRNRIKEWYTENLQSIVKKQWQNTLPWKSTEYWPDNNQTLIDNCTHKSYKVYFFCNDNKSWLRFPGKKILLYTDVKTQLRLSHFKKAWVFLNKPSDHCYKIMKNVLRQSTNVSHDIQVSKNVHQVFDIAEHRIKLQQFLLNPKDLFGEEHTLNQKNLVSTWMALHPQQLLRKIGL